jgi:hypothetical protein
MTVCILYLYSFHTPLTQLLVRIFHAGTREVNDSIYTNGGRVLVVAAYAPTLEKALEYAYQGIETINFEGKNFRRDIARRLVFLLPLLCLTLKTILFQRTHSRGKSSCG